MLKVWDISTRIYHWLQAIVFLGLVATAYGGLSAEGVGPEGLGGKELHSRLGLILLVLLIWRLGWGVFGSETSRFSQFLRSPSEIACYIKGQRPPEAGHNPLGALMVIILIASLFLQGSIGLMMTDWVDGKSLLGRSVMRTLGDVHEVNSLFLIALCTIHVLAACIYRLKGHYLIRAMFTGMIELPDQVRAPKFESNHRAFIWFISSIAAVAGIIKLLS